ncbi:MAG TPA: hypothetical protein VK138_00960 [Acidiferrobacterales bacterium]|nr:hypothetical protein [Acidiferrobacterales bacterium]
MLVPTLYQFFRRHIQQGFKEHGLAAEPATVEYVSDILTRFARTPNLYAVHDADGAPLEHLGQFLIEYRRAQGLEEAPADRSRQVLLTRHLGEYALFMSGLFREHLQARGQLGYYLDHGRSAFGQSADFEANPKRAQVFRRLYLNFEPISGTLNYIRRAQFPMKSPVLALESPLVALWRM